MIESMNRDDNGPNSEAVDSDDDDSSRFVVLLLSCFDVSWLELVVCTIKTIEAHTLNSRDSDIV